jgi:hypothetical protein
MARSNNKEEPTTTATEKHFSGLHKLVQILSFLVVFVAGIVIGIATTSNINRQFKNSQSDISSFVSIVRSCEKTRERDGIDHGGGGGFVAAKKEEEEEESCWSMKGYLRPKNISHSMSDKELLWRASLVPKKEEYPYKRIPKVAFMFLTRGPLPMLPLWERFFLGKDKEKFSIYVHSPPGFDLNVSKDSPFYGRQIPSQVCVLLGFSCCYCVVWICVS